MEYEPVLVGNPGMKVTFQCNRATAFDVIRAVGDQTRIPIGVALGRDSDALRATGGFWRYPGSLLLVSAFCIAERSFAMAPGDRYAEMVQAGTEAVTRGDLSVAKAQLEAAVSLQPGESSGWCELGVLYAQLGDYSRGEKAFRRALDLQPGLARAHYLLGLSLIAHPKDQLDWPAAIEEFRSALKIQPDYPEALNYLGVGLTSTGQLDAAIAELEHALLLAPQMPSAHFNLAIALENLGRLEDAATEYQKAIALKSYYAPAYSALGKLYFRMGKGPAAEEELRIALRQNPDLQDAHYALGRVLRSEGKLQDAEIEFHAAVSLGQREPNAVESTQLSNAALEKAGRGDLAGAETALRKAIALRPDYGVPHYNLGLILADEGRIDEAGRQLTEAISLMPGQAKPWFDLGRVQRLQGKPQSAVESVRWAAMLDPANPRIREELKLAGSAGDQGDAPTQPRQPEIGLSADTASGHYSSARDLRARQDWQGAIGELLRSLALQPDSVEVRSLLADTYGQLGDYDAAAVEYRKVLLAAPASGETYLSLGKVLLAGGKRRDAGEAFHRALAIQPDSVEVRRAIDDLAASDPK